jgi:hypothetical protein
MTEQTEAKRKPGQAEEVRPLVRSSCENDGQRHDPQDGSDMERDSAHSNKNVEFQTDVPAGAPSLHA